MVYKFFSIIVVLCLSFFTTSILSKDLNELVGKKLIITWDNSSCETSIYEWKEVTSSCYSGSYSLKVVNQSNGVNFFKWGPVPRNNKPSFFDGVIYFEDGSFASLFLEDVEGAKWSVSKPKLRIENIEFTQKNKIKREIYNFNITFIDKLIKKEQSSEKPNSNTLQKLSICKEIPFKYLEEEVKNFESIDFKKINKDMEIYMAVSANSDTDKLSEELFNWMMKVDSEKESLNIPESFNKISSVESFQVLLAAEMNYEFGCMGYMAYEE